MLNHYFKYFTQQYIYIYIYIYIYSFSNIRIQIYLTLTLFLQQSLTALWLISLVCTPYTKGFSPGGIKLNIILASFLFSEY